MVVWFAHVRVGHRQLSIPKNPLNLTVKGVFACVRFEVMNIAYCLLLIA